MEKSIKVVLSFVLMCWMLVHVTSSFADDNVYITVFPHATLDRPIIEDFKVFFQQYGEHVECIFHAPCVIKSGDITCHACIGTACMGAVSGELYVEADFDSPGYYIAYGTSTIRLKIYKCDNDCDNDTALCLCLLVLDRSGVVGISSSNCDYCKKNDEITCKNGGDRNNNDLKLHFDFKVLPKPVEVKNVYVCINVKEIPINKNFNFTFTPSKCMVNDEFSKVLTIGEGTGMHCTKSPFNDLPIEVAKNNSAGETCDELFSGPVDVRNVGEWDLSVKNDDKSGNAKIIFAAYLKAPGISAVTNMAGIVSNNPGALCINDAECHDKSQSWDSVETKDLYIQFVYDNGAFSVMPDKNINDNNDDL